MASSQSGGLQVIGAGLMNTGTACLHDALEKLIGSKCYHMKTALSNPDHAEFWFQACKEEPSDDEWREFFKDYTAVVDFLAVVFYERLIRVFPNAKVVLTVRDPEKWFENMEKTKASAQKFLAFFKLQHDCLIKAFRDHVKRVKQTVPPERLLIYQVADGWQPLCDFLRVSVPEEPYPCRPTCTEHACAEEVDAEMLKPLMPRKKKIIIWMSVLFSVAAIILVYSSLSHLFLQFEQVCSLQLYNFTTYNFTTYNSEPPEEEPEEEIHLD